MSFDRVDAASLLAFARHLARHPRAVPGLIVLTCLAILGAALASQYWGGLQPCVLCYYQRYAYVAAALCGGLGLLVGGAPLARAAATGLAGLAFLVGAGIAAFHVGVEQKWWKGTAECHAPAVDFSADVKDQLDQLLNQPFVACDQVAWSLFGISMAGYNVLTSLFLAGLSFWLARAMIKP